MLYSVKVEPLGRGNAALEDSEGVDTADKDNYQCTDYVMQGDPKKVITRNFALKSLFNKKKKKHECNNEQFCK